MADRYWVGGAGNWTTTNTTNWSTSSGGTGGASVPTLADNVFIDSLSGSSSALLGQVTQNAVCNNLSITFGNFTAAASITITIYGNLNYAPTTNGFIGTFQFASSNTGNTIALNGRTWTGNTTKGSFSFGSVGGWTFLDTLNNNSNASQLTVTVGSVTFTSDVTIGSVVISGAGAKTLNMGTGTWTLVGPAAVGNSWADTSTATIFASSATIVIAPTGTGARTFAGNSKTFGTLSVGTGISATRFLTITGNNTFTNFVNLTTSPTVKFTSGSTNTIYNWNYNGSSGSPAAITSTVGTAFTLAKGITSLGQAGFTTNASYVTINNSRATGGVWNAFTANGNTDGGGNTGWNFSPASQLITRLSSTGTLYSNAEFNEITKTIVSVSSTTVYAKTFDEVTIHNRSVAQSITNTGTLRIAGEFNEITGIY
jgi:hypothetical protein